MNFDDLETEKHEIIQVVGTPSTQEMKCKDGDILPLLAMRNMMLFPGVVLPIHVGREKSLKLIRSVYKKEGELIACTQYDSSIDDPSFNEVHNVGCVAEIIKVLDMPDGSTAVILQGKSRAMTMNQVSEEPYMKVTVRPIEDFCPDNNDSELKAISDDVTKLGMRIAKETEILPDELNMTVGKIDDRQLTINFWASNFKCDARKKVELIDEANVLERGLKLLALMNARIQMLDVKKRVRRRVKGNIDRQQRDYFIREEIKSLQDELNGDSYNDGFAGNGDIDEFLRQAKTKKWNYETERHFNAELLKMEHMNPASPDYQVQYAYLKTLLELPWNEYTKDNFNLKKAEKVINRNHFGMDKVKERIIEYLAVLKMKGDMKSPIICLYGPPGVGKTSLGKSIAETLGRKYARVSLGGVSDESEIRGHRKTYIGAMPGRIISNINKCGSSNPVFMLDEIDKLSRDIHGDPASALLEVLDPEQNSTFHDNYLDTDFDLSHVLFIATANDISTIPRPLLDRMELIEISGYVTEEKIEIANRHLIPQQLEKHGIHKSQVKFAKGTVKAIIENYTRESGVRALDKQIAKIMRKAARTLADNEDAIINVSTDNLTEFLGISHIDHDYYDIEGYTGVVTGLAWTQVGGEILFIESALNRQKECKLSLTGNLGDVMKESAQLALEYIKSHSDELGINQSMLDEHGIHIHVPEGATPKDGPSAGITILTAMVSSLTGRKVKNKLAMTGEITLRGKLLPVGGIKEKILAAKRAGIHEILLCIDNKKDIDEINTEYLEGLNFHFVRTMQEALSIALYPQK